MHLCKRAAACPLEAPGMPEPCVLIMFIPCSPPRKDLPDSSVGKESACNAGDTGSIPGSGRSLGEGIGYPLHYSGLENPMDCTVCGVAKSWTRLSDFHFTSPPRRKSPLLSCCALSSTQLCFSSPVNTHSLPELKPLYYGAHKALHTLSPHLLQ